MKKLTLLLFIATLTFSCKNKQYTYQLTFTDGTTKTIRSVDKTVTLQNGCVNFNESCDCLNPSSIKQFCYVREINLISIQKL